MSKLVYIKPAQTNSKFWHNPQVQGYSHFPETFRSYPPYWDHTAHKYMFVGLTDEEVISLASKAKLSHSEGSKEGTPITEIDLSHKENEFFNHPRMITKIKDDVTVFNLSSPLDVLKLATMKAYPHVAHSEADKKKIPGAKWVIIDEEIEQKNNVDEFRSKMEINEYFVGKNKLSTDKMKTILMAFNDPNIKVDNSTDADTVSSWLYDKATDTTVRQGRSDQQRFFDLVKMKSEDLAIRALISKAVKAGALRVKSGKYFYAGNEIAYSLEAAIKKLSAPENQSLLNAIEEEINFKNV
jgi:hypothetical protein